MCVFVCVGLPFPPSFRPGWLSIFVIRFSRSVGSGPYHSLSQFQMIFFSSSSNQRNNELHRNIFLKKNNALCASLGQYPPNPVISATQIRTINKTPTPSPPPLKKKPFFLPPIETKQKNFPISFWWQTRVWWIDFSLVHDPLIIDGHFHHHHHYHHHHHHHRHHHHHYGHWHDCAVRIGETSWKRRKQKGKKRKRGEKRSHRTPVRFIS